MDENPNDGPHFGHPYTNLAVDDDLTEEWNYDEKRCLRAAPARKAQDQQG